MDLEESPSIDDLGIIMLPGGNVPPVPCEECGAIVDLEIQQEFTKDRF